MNIEKFEILKQLALSVHTKATTAFILIIGFLCYYIMYQERKIATMQVRIDEQRVEADNLAIDQKIGQLNEKNKQLNRDLSDIDATLKKLKKQEEAVKKEKELSDKQVEDFWGKPDDQNNK